MKHYLEILIVTCALLAAGPSYALSVPSGELETVQIESGESNIAVPTELHVAQSDGLTLSQAVEQVRRQYKGRIVSAETKRNGNKEVHHIKVLLEDGKVKTVRVPGRKTG